MVAYHVILNDDETTRKTYRTYAQALEAYKAEAAKQAVSVELDKETSDFYKRVHRNPARRAA